jgi:hypothetical protein
MMLMPFGKYRGQPISSVPETYLRWLAEPQGWSARLVTPEVVEAARAEFVRRDRRSEVHVGGVGQVRRDILTFIFELDRAGVTLQVDRDDRVRAEPAIAPPWQAFLEAHVPEICRVLRATPTAVM